MKTKDSLPERCCQGMMGRLSGDPEVAGSERSCSDSRYHRVFFSLHVCSENLQMYSCVPRREEEYSEKKEKAPHFSLFDDSKRTFINFYTVFSPPVA